MDNDGVIRKYARFHKSANHIFGKQKGKDVAQEAIATFIARGEKSGRQRNYFALVDAVRTRGLRTYDRRGRTSKSISQGEFHSDANSFYGTGEITDDESSDAHPKGIYSFVQLVSMLKSPKDIQVVILHDTYEWTLREISHPLGVSESRICQIYRDAKISLKKIAIQESLSSCEQDRSEQKSQRLLPRETEILRNLPIETKRALEYISSQKAKGKSKLDKRPKPKIYKIIFKSFAFGKIKNAKSSSHVAEAKLER